MDRVAPMHWCGGFAAFMKQWLGLVAQDCSSNAACASYLIQRTHKFRLGTLPCEMLSDVLLGLRILH